MDEIFNYDVYGREKILSIENFNARTHGIPEGVYKFYATEVTPDNGLYHVEPGASVRIFGMRDHFLFMFICSEENEPLARKKLEKEIGIKIKDDSGTKK
ncbi:MAG: hypothetical protein ABIA78_00140 [archaeon]